MKTLKVSKMRMWSFMLILLLTSMLGYSQNSVDSKKNHTYTPAVPFHRLNIGDRLPDNIISQVVNYDSSSLNLSTLKGTPFILDFWNKYCSICISTFPKIERLQDTFNNKLSFLTVTTDSLEDFVKLKKRSAIVNNLRLPVIYQDSLLSHVLFPSNSVPYYVWVDDMLIVRAITNAYEVNSKNIEAFVERKYKDIDQRYDILDEKIYYELISEDSSSKIFELFHNRFLKNLIYFNESITEKTYSSILESATPGSLREIVLPFSIVNIKNSEGDVVGMRVYNRDIVSLLKLAYNFEEVAFRKIIIDDNISQIPFEPNNENFEDHERWRIQNSYSYECFIGSNNKKSTIDVLRNDIEFYFNIKGLEEKRMWPCLVIRNDPKANKNTMISDSAKHFIENTRTNRGIIFNDIEVNNFISWVSSQFNSNLDPIVINETKYNKNSVFKKIVLNLNSVRNINELKDELLKYGLVVSLENRIIKMLSIKKSEQ